MEEDMGKHYMWFHRPSRQWRLSESAEHMEGQLCWIHSCTSDAAQPRPSASHNPSQYDLSSNPLELERSGAADTPSRSGPTAESHHGQHAPVCDTASLRWKVCKDANEGSFLLDERIVVTPQYT